MKRLFDDPAAPPELRADLQRSRRAGEDYDAFAKLPQLRAALTDPSRQIDDSATSGAPGVLSASRLTWPRLHVAPWTWKLALIAAIGGASLVAFWPERQPSEPAPAAVAKPAATVTAPRPLAVEPRVAQPTAAAPLALEEPAPPASVAPQPAFSSRREIEQLVRIRALIKRDPAAAYRLAQRSEQEFPRGVLSEEREALQVVALAKSGAAEAAARKARDFLARYPESPMRERVESSVKP